jgi:cytoskeletal protein CcmA (bactofilin family)
VIHGTINGDIIATQRLELGRAAKVHGNIQTPSLIIEQGAIFEGTCKMLQMSQAADKAKTSAKKEEPLDTSRMKPIPADAAKPADIPAATSVVN